ncbi:SDR family oxidoreductase [Mycolicibacterium sp. S2-37]|uniref:SDR family NAD(P)-dependent oxidoreductase n=1 Tax=Mycolicibacterium sp. S2-37 TaxID=2810297 RepID=UPI001A9536EB|nr:SDR family oxidoreductase [Mycolicibacterium sp. S2-37]MBO0678489.1 SDR family oxidoreductase [Mycolicibacterium sp. S2-37]
MDLTDRVAVVTGGGTGIGAAIAHRLVAAGARGVLVTWSRSEQAAAETVASLRAAGAEADAVAVDVRAEDQVRELATRCQDLFGGCDVLVNNAASTAWVPFGDLDALDDETWHDILDVNVVGAFRCARAFAPALRQSGGAIVNIASISAYRGIGSSLPYGVSKAALLQLTRSLAVALGPEVRVNSVSPGTVATRWQLDHHGDEAFDEMTAREREVAPLGRTTQPTDVAAVVLGLLTADMVTGVDVVVDAGKHLMY